ncbi:hypothetical protein BGW36DRAFT_442638 [Talaromyces proteolyticus]|uniref:FAD-binding PCMH-type domain-containing protein n=1 Tax=Talaromyces proteolyticus TaxID=1131652 RepID=A0AAD4KG69_9EURO|nr:uncharacterized protein BGW36DRAFT_442638 [Talaromyces proteolyticus]KAH8688736.1 hypothetical protein BGW36DRAFT_442638 [Talaromyces proteolyticus]
MADSRLSALEAFLKDYPSIKYIPPSSADFASVREVWYHGRRDTPLAILQPQSAEEVSLLVKYAKENGIQFTVRVGGHNLEGRAIVDGALVIDLRALTSVTVADDLQSATVQGGILQQDLAIKLWSKGLVTPIGTIPAVGYVGWATYGGYGPFSSHWGLGVDQIIGATVVNSNGDIIKADENLLKGIRGAGGTFGVIVDVTVKVYPLKSLLAGAIIFDAQDICKALTEFNAAYRRLLEDGLPSELTIQQLVYNAPPGRLFGVSFFWSSDNTEEGQRWKEKIASLGPVIMNTVALKNIPDWVTEMRALVPSSVYGGGSHTHNLKQITTEAAQVLGRNLSKMPSDPACMFSVHQLRGPSTSHSTNDSNFTYKNNSVFAEREPHYMLEILGFSTTEENKHVCEQWASDLANQFQQETDTTNILPHAYISLDPINNGNMVRIFGSHAEEVFALKKTYDPDNVFALALPLLK